MTPAHGGAACPQHSGIQTQLVGHKERLAEIGGEIEVLHGRCTENATRIARIEGRIAGWAALGGVVGTVLAKILLK